MPLRPYITDPLLPGQMFHIYNRGNEQGTLICYEQANYEYFLRKLQQYMSDYLNLYAYCILPDHYHLAAKVRPIDEVLEAATRDLKKIRKDAWERVKRMVEAGDKVFQEGEAVLTEGTDSESGSYLPVFRNAELPVFQKLAILSQPHPPYITDILPQLTEAGKLYLAAWAVSERMRRFNLAYSKAVNKQQGRRGSLMQKPFRRKRFDTIEDMCRLIRYIHRNPVHHGYVNTVEEYPWSSYGAYVKSAKTKLKKEEAMGWFGGKEHFVAYHSQGGGAKFHEPD